MSIEEIAACLVRTLPAVSEHRDADPRLAALRRCRARRHLTDPARGGQASGMDWTGQPNNFVIPVRTAEQHQKWRATWKEILDALVNVASEGERETVRTLFEKEVPYEAPRGWMRDLEKVF